MENKDRSDEEEKSLKAYFVKHAHYLRKSDGYSQGGVGGEGKKVKA